MRPLNLDSGSFEYKRRVQFAETDLAGIVHFSAFFRYMEEAEHALWRAAGLSVANDGLHWPRVSASCDYAKPLLFEDEIIVKVRAGFGRSRIQYGFEISRTDTVAATGSMTSVCTQTGAGGMLKPVEIPQDVVERLRSVLR